MGKDCSKGKRKLQLQVQLGDWYHKAKTQSHHGSDGIEHTYLSPHPATRKLGHFILTSVSCG